jgi:hypothetical protein
LSKSAGDQICKLLKASSLWTESSKLVSELISWLQSKQEELDQLVESMPNSGLVMDFKPYMTAFSKASSASRRSIPLKSYKLGELFGTSICNQQQAVVLQYAKPATAASDPKPASTGACATLLEEGISDQVSVSEESIMAIQSAFVAFMVRRSQALSDLESTWHPLHTLMF